jgi:hypothetical protein
MFQVPPFVYNLLFGLQSLMESNKFLAETVGKVVVVNIKDIYLTVSHMALLVLTGTLLLFVTVVVLKFYIVKCKNMLTSALYVYHTLSMYFNNFFLLRKVI